jgi:hypothetical protein
VKKPSHGFATHPTLRPRIALDRLQAAVLAALRREAMMERRLLRTRVQATREGARDE